MNFAAIQYDIAWEDKEANHRIVEQMLAEADLAPGTFVLLPELGDTGFSFNLEKTVDDRSLIWAKDLARKTGLWIQVGYPAIGDDGRGRNCATILSPEGREIATYGKVHPFSFGREIEFFTGGDRLVTTPCDESIICPLICYDLRFPELWRLGAAGGTSGGAAGGAEVFTIGASWPDARQSHWRALLIARAIENQAFVVACNRVGEDPHLSYAGGSLIISPKGKVLAEAGEEPAVIQAELDLNILRQWRKDFPALADMKKLHLEGVAVDKPGVQRSDQ